MTARTDRTDSAALYGLHNLPYGVASADGAEPRPVTRLGDEVVEIAALVGDLAPLFTQPTLDAFLAAGRPTWDDVRARLASALADGVPAGLGRGVDTVRMHLPFTVADYVDFYASEHHATNLGRLFRPDGEALMPNWKHLPVGYTGRAASVVASGTDVVRPCGQRRPPGSDAPTFGPSTRLDIEAEIGFVVGTGNAMGRAIDIADVDDHLFGVVLLNDWSARDIQAWEYVPLGPHLGKSFATTISPWIVPMAALREARVDVPGQEPVLPYLAMERPWGLDIELEVEWNGEVVSRPPYASTYWSPAQMLAHLTVNGAPTRSGDLFASGTVSGPERRQRGAFIELTWGGAEPVEVAGEQRTFLEDDDVVVLRATAPGPGGTRLGFGEARGRVVPALDPHPSARTAAHPAPHTTDRTLQETS